MLTGKKTSMGTLGMNNLAGHRHWLLEERVGDGWSWITSFEFTRPQSFRTVLKKCDITDDHRIRLATIDESIAIRERCRSFPILERETDD